MSCHVMGLKWVSLSLNVTQISDEKDLTDQLKDKKTHISRTVNTWQRFSVLNSPYPTYRHHTFRVFSKRKHCSIAYLYFQLYVFHPPFALTVCCR